MIHPQNHFSLLSLSSSLSLSLSLSLLFIYDHYQVLSITKLSITSFSMIVTDHFLLSRIINYYISMYSFFLIIILLYHSTMTITTSSHRGPLGHRVAMAKDKNHAVSDKRKIPINRLGKSRTRLDKPFEIDTGYIGCCVIVLFYNILSRIT